jgi:hypothetical protein
LNLRKAFSGRKLVGELLNDLKEKEETDSDLSKPYLIWLIVEGTYDDTMDINEVEHIFNDFKLKRT